MAATLTLFPAPAAAPLPALPRRATQPCAPAPALVLSSPAARSKVRVLTATLNDTQSSVELARERLMSMKVVELQSLLVERQLAKSGKKEVLVNRLLTHAEQHSEDTLLPLSQPAITDTGTLTGAQLQGATIIVDTPPAPARRKTRTRRSATATATADTADAPISQPLPTSAAATTADALAGSQDLQAASVAIQSVQTSTVGTEVGEERVVGDEGAQEDGGELEYATLPPDAPPLPVYRRRRSWALADKPDMDNSELKNLLSSNPQDLQLTFLGTAADTPTANRALASVALLRAKDVWLFDVGDDTQRQLGVLQHVKPSKLSRIFITRLAPETLLGLPGLLCTVSAARVKGHEKTDLPLHIYGPRGLADYLDTIFKVSFTYMEINILVIELTDYPVPNEYREPVLLNSRARIYRTLLPPDQLHQDGYFDGRLTSFTPTQRSERGRRASDAVTEDERAGFRPFPLPPQGDPDRTDVRGRDLQWTIEADSGARVTAVGLPSNQPTFAYVFQEADRAGALAVERCNALGVRPGRNYTRLKDGHHVMSEDGRLVLPELVVTADRPGRNVVIMGSAPMLPGQDSAFARVSRGADAWVSGCVVPDASREQALGNGDAPSVSCVPVKELAAYAASLEAEVLLLARFPTLGGGQRDVFHTNGAHQQEDPSEQLVATALAEAQTEVSRAARQVKSQNKTSVRAVSDFWVQVFEKHEGPGPAEHDKEEQ